MSRQAAELLLAIAGALHFLQLPSMRYLSRGLMLRADLQRLTPLNSRLVMLFVGGVMVLLLGLGACAMLQPEAWLRDGLGPSLLLLLALFWAARAVAQAWLRPWWPKGRGNRVLLYGLWALYAALAVTYGGLFGASAAQRTPVATCPSAGS
jgi:hypothetical protein